LQVKEVRLPAEVGADDRFIVCFNPDAAERDRHVRDRLLAQLRELIDGTDPLPADKRAELRGQISTKPGLARLLRVTASGLLRIDQPATARKTARPPATAPPRPPRTRPGGARPCLTSPVLPSPARPPIAPRSPTSPAPTTAPPSPSPPAGPPLRPGTPISAPASPTPTGTRTLAATPTPISRPTTNNYN
jgi:hypothetical protein